MCHINLVTTLLADIFVFCELLFEKVQLLAIAFRATMSREIIFRQIVNFGTILFEQLIFYQLFSSISLYTVFHT